MKRRGQLPKIWRKRGKGGKYSGNCYVTLNHEDVNLGTKDQNLAQARRLEAMKGRRDFDTDATAAADAMEQDRGGAGGELSGGEGSPVGESAPPAPIVPDQVIPPAPPPPALPPIAPASSSPEGPDDMAAAAAEVGGGGAANDNAGAGADAFGVENLQAMLGLAAPALVKLQLYLQGLAAKRIAGAAPPPVELDPQLEAAVAKAWTAQLEIWLPRDLPLAPWMVAVALPLLVFPAQLEGARAAKAAADAGKAAA